MSKHYRTTRKHYQLVGDPGANYGPAPSSHGHPWVSDFKPVGGPWTTDGRPVDHHYELMDYPWATYGTTISSNG